MKEEGLIEQVTFDSGGFFVQMGKITYEEMYWQLLQFYREHDWADWYTLPDYMPLSTDDENTRWYKTRRSANGSRSFFQEMPGNQRSRALPVIQGRTRDQIDHCLETFIPLGITRLGFGSFGTNGKESSSNLLTTESLGFVSYISKILQGQRISLHAFGVGTPPIVYLLHSAGVDSFDSIGWMKTAGFGKVYLPFIRAYNITYDDRSARGMQKGTFEELKHLTQHKCTFCESFEMLTTKREHRVLHNLAVIHDTVEMVLAGKAADLLYLMDAYAPTYTRLRRTITDNGN
jgi:queuine/archaeosine tRNA-ribosyltransferase